jgi:glyoxylase-like metal-dependent hydrolase (beta-lactamase superfamily II)
MTAAAPRPSLEGIRATDASFEGVPLTVYAIEGAHGVALVDCGIAPTPDQHLRPLLRAAGADLEDVRWLLVTHGHHDHVGGAAAVRRARPDVQIAAHRLDAGWTESGARYLASLYRAAFPGVWDPPAPFEERILRLAGDDVAVDRLLEDGDVVEAAGRRLRVHHAPAHTPGHVLFHDEDAGALFVGDAIQGRGTLNTERLSLFPLYDSVPAYRAALERVRALAPREAYSAHYGVLDPAALEALLDESERVVGEIQALLDELLAERGAITLADAADAAVARWPQYERALNVFVTLSAHLDAMVQAGTARPVHDSGRKRWHRAGSELRPPR